MPFFEYFANEPLANRDLIESGAGAVGLTNASRAYNAVDNALETAATGTDGLIKTMADAWPGGLSSQRAQAAFHKHNNWVREQARIAAQFSQLADRGATLHNDALQAMPSRFEIELTMAALAATAGLMATSGAVATAGAGPVSAAALVVFGAASAAHAAAEVQYNRLKFQAGLTMAAYELGAILLVSDLLTTATALTPPPPIVIPGPGSVPAITHDPVGPLQSLIKNGPDSPHYPGNKPTTTQQHTGNSNGNGTESTGDSKPGGSDSGTGGDGTDAKPSGPEQQSLSEPQQTLGSESGFDSGANGYGGSDSANSSPLLGVSSESSTLAALGSGGAVPAFGMARGGIGSMPGAATGFRLPGGWNPASGTAFGAANPTASTGAPARGPARRVSAPTARMRRRRKDEEQRTGKVFTPGEQFEVPELERPPVIGVIEYQDDEPDTELLADSSLVGVLDRLDEENEPENEHSAR